MYTQKFIVAYLAIGMMLLSGCTTTQIRPVTLPKPFKPSNLTVEWVKVNKAPDHVVDDLVDCTALGLVIEKTSDAEPVKRTQWNYSAILDYVWSGIKGAVGWLFGWWF